MPRIYKPDPRGSRYKKYDEQLIKEAITDYKNSGKSLKAISDKYNINKSVLYRHSTRTMKKHGGQTVLSEETEKEMIKYINICAEWGYPFDSLDLRFVVKNYLDKIGRTVLKFKNNLPGPDFVASFLKRHSQEISQRNCQNIKRSRAAVSAHTIQAYFRELETSLADIDPSKIVNYDETNLTDDPGRKKIITKRGTKYPERVMNHSKSSTSIMMSATASGDLLPPYVVYKAQNIYDTWRENGPPGTRYNRTQSGWFDANTFEDWIKTIVLPYFRGKEGKKCLIGDNLSSHLSLDVINLCHKENISFVFLPANSTHLTQPLDVAFFRPMKIAWRNILVRWKKTDGKNQASVPKGCFPRLLKKLVENLSENSKTNILAGFKKTGIWPLDGNQVLSRLPKDNREQNEDAVDKSVLDILKEMRYGTMNITEPRKKRKLEVIPGRSVGNNESEDYVETEEESTQKKNKENKTDIITKKGKGKGIGKKTKKQEGVVINKGKETIPIIMTDTYNKQEDNNRQEDNSVINECCDLQETTLHENFSLDLLGADVESIPILFEDVLTYGEEIVMNEGVSSDTQPIQINLQSTDTIINPPNNEIQDTHSFNKNNNYGNDEENHDIKCKGKVVVLADKKISEIKLERKIDCKKSTHISKNAYLKVLKKNNEHQPSTSGGKTISSRKRYYYRNDCDILKDLLDDSI